MSETAQPEMAVHEYRQFIRRLGPSPARNVGSDEPDTSAEPVVDVSPLDAVQVFLKLHPKNKEFRERLLEEHKDRQTLRLNRDRWQQIAGNEM